MTEERRRSRRYPLMREEIAVVHDLQHDRPATLIDFSATGALIVLVELVGLPECRLNINDRTELSLQGDTNPFYARARVARRGPTFLAVEFDETRGESLSAIQEKLRRLDELQTTQRRAAKA